MTAIRGTVAYFDHRAPARATDQGVIVEVAPGAWEPCNPTWAATFAPLDDFGTWELEMAGGDT